MEQAHDNHGPQKDFTLMNYKILINLDWFSLNGILMRDHRLYYLRKDMNS